MQGAIPKFIPYIGISPLFHQEANNLNVPAFHGQVEGGLLVDVFSVGVRSLGKSREEGERERAIKFKNELRAES